MKISISQAGELSSRQASWLIVKRAGKDEQGSWLLVSDHPEWKPVPWPDDAKTLGEVKWSAVEW